MGPARVHLDGTGRNVNSPVRYASSAWELLGGADAKGLASICSFPDLNWLNVNRPSVIIRRIKVFAFKLDIGLEKG